MERTVIVRGASGFGGHFPGQAVPVVRVPVCCRRAFALKGPGQVDAGGASRARPRGQLYALVDVPADAIWLQPVASWTDAEASLSARVDTLLVDGTRVRCGTVSAGGNAVVVFPVEHRRASAVAVVQAEKVSWALELVRTANQFVAVDLRIARISGRALARRPVADDAAPRILSAGVGRETRVITFQQMYVASLVGRTVGVSGTFPSRRFASVMERLSRRAWRACALVAANVVVALSTVRARERVLLAFVDVPADSIWHQNKSLGADAEAHLAALIHALLVLRAGIGRGAVDARQNAEIVPLQERLRATAAISEALKVSWTLVVMDARSSNGALHVGISTKSTGAVAFWTVIHATAFGTTTADTGL